MLNMLTLLAASEAGGAVKRNVRALGYFAVAGCAMVLGTAFLLLAGRDALLPHMTPAMANLAVGGGMLLVGIVLLLIGQYVRRRRSGTSALASTAIVAAPLAARVVGKGINVATITVAGVVLGAAVLGHMLTKKD